MPRRIVALRIWFLTQLRTDLLNLSRHLVAIPVRLMRRSFSRMRFAFESVALLVEGVAR